MQRYWPILFLLFVAATAEENKLYRVARSAFNDGIYELAERQCTELLQTYPDSEYADLIHLWLAQSKLKQGKWAEATTVLQDAIKRWPLDKRPDSFRFWLAEAYIAGKNYLEAIKWYEELISRFPRSPYRSQALYGLSFAEFKSGQYEKAANVQKDLEKLKLNGDLGHENLLLNGQIELALKHFDQAEAIFRSAIEQFPGKLIFYESHIWLGESKARQGHYEEALAMYNVVTEAYATKPNKLITSQTAADAWYRIGWANWQQEKFENAALAFSSALELAQDIQLKRNALLKLGEAYVRGGKVDEGVEKLKEFVKVNPGDVLADEIVLAIGNILFSANYFEKAMTEFLSLITVYPNSKLIDRAHFHAGWCAWNLQRYVEAASYFEKTYSLATANSGQTTDVGLAAEALFKLGDTQFLLRRHADTIRSYKKLISTYPRIEMIDRAVFQLGLAYQQTRDGEAATATFESLIEQFPQSEYAPEAQFNLGLVAIGEGNETQAREAFAAVLANYPESPYTTKSALAIGESFYREGKLEEAIAEFTRLISENGDSGLVDKAIYNRGWCVAELGKPQETLSAFTEFIKKSPNSLVAPDVQFWIADYYSKLNDHIRAQEQFQSLAQNYPTSALADSAQFMAGRSAYARQDYKAAIEMFENLLKKFPKSTWCCDARFGQGDALTELGQFGDALLIFDSLVLQFPDCYLACEGRGRKGDCLFTLGRYEEALTSYRQALDCLKDADPAVRNQLNYKIGQSYEKLGKIVEAFEQYSKVVYETIAAPDSRAPLEKFWLCKAGLAGITVQEQREQWREAITLSQKLTDLCPDMKPLLEERIRRLRVEHFIFF